MTEARTIGDAVDFVEEHHAGQVYEGPRGVEYPYLLHLIHAKHVALRFGIKSDVMLTAVLLHDVLEDTDATYGDVERIFGSEVARIVAAVTDGHEGTRRERKAATHLRIAAQPGATGVKLCDRIANVEHGIKYGSRHTAMYAREHDEFRAALYVEGEWTEMWAYLDRLIGKERDD